jgi:hypothetical protein
MLTSAASTQPINTVAQTADVRSGLAPTVEQLKQAAIQIRDFLSYPGFKLCGSFMACFGAVTDSPYYFIPGVAMLVGSYGATLHEYYSGQRINPLRDKLHLSRVVVMSAFGLLFGDLVHAYEHQGQQEPLE